MGSWSRLLGARPLPLWLLSRRFPRGPEGRAQSEDSFQRAPLVDPLLSGQEAEFEVDVSEYLGPLLFVKLSKWHLLQDDAWFCNSISVQGPGASGDEFRFPRYRWLEGKGILSLPEGTGEQRGGLGV